MAESARVQIHSFLKGGTLKANYMTVLSLLTRLRQTCDSPELVLSAFSREDETLKKPTPEALACAASLTAGELLNCSLCFDQVEREGGAVTACGHAFCYECIVEYLYAGAEKIDVAPSRACPITACNCKELLSPDRLFKLETIITTPLAQNELTAAIPSTSKDSARPRESTKTQRILEAVATMRSSDPSAKCLIFSSYTKYLDILEPCLTAAGCMFARIDGSQSVRKREEQLDIFHADGTCVLLMSLKCGVGLNLTEANTVILTEPWWNPFIEEQAIDRTHRIGQERPVRVLRFATPDTVEEQILVLQERKRELAVQTLGDHGVEHQQQDSGAAVQLQESDILSIFGLSAEAAVDLSECSVEAALGAATVADKE